MKTTITQLNAYTVDKKGYPLTTKDGRPYIRLTIKTKDTGEQLLSGFESNNTRDWQVGSVVDIQVTEKTIEGKTYLNFRAQSKLDLLEDRISKIETIIRAIQDKIGVPKRNENGKVEYAQKQKTEPPKYINDEPAGEEEIKPSDLDW